MPLTYVERGISSFGRLSDYYSADLIDAFAQVEDKNLQYAFEEALLPSRKSMLTTPKR